jgi:hypothetical protein
MTTLNIDRFDPFNNRLCRNVRNALSESFKKVLDRKEMQPVQRVVGVLMNDPLPACVKTYIDQRQAAYAQVLADIRQHPCDHPLDIAFVIWGRGLFFETHEYLEQHWMAAGGDEKILFQAIIRAAGAYVHLEQGNLDGAKRMAAKALAVLEAHQERLSPHADPRQLLARLRTLDPVPPMLAGTVGPGNRQAPQDPAILTATPVKPASRRLRKGAGGSG